MSVRVNLNGLPSHVLDNVYKCDGLKMARSDRSENALAPLSFPKSKALLWDPTPTGDGVRLHLCYNRNPRLLLTEKALRLAHRHARQSNRPHFSCFLLGNIVVDTDEEGVTVSLDRFDPGRAQPGGPGKVPTALLPGDVLVPCVFGAQGAESADLTVFSAEDLKLSFKMLQHSCSSVEPLDLSKLLVLRGLLGCSQQADRQGFSLRWAAVTVANTLDTVPVRAVAIIPTALARNLSALSSLAQPLTSAGRKQGFLTMDKTRKLLLILESDPKACTLPLVGVWLSGVTHMSHPQVWAWCLRYLCSSSLQDRVMSEGGCFLVVLYSLTHREPEFFQVQAGSSAQQETSFQMLTGAESLTLYQDVEVSKGHTVQFELSAESQNSETEFFREVLSQSSLSRAAPAAVASPLVKLSASDHDSGVEDDDLSPRPSPNPHPLSQQTKRIHPSVPELSLVMEGSFAVGGPRRGSLDSGSSHTPPPPAVQHRGGGPDYHVHPGPRPPHGQEPPQHDPPTLRRPLLPVTHKGKAPLTPERQQLLGPPSNRKSTPPFGSRTKDGCRASSSPLSASPSGRFGLSHGDSLQQERPMPVSVSLSRPSPRCSPERSPEPPPPPAHTRPGHFHSTPNPNLNQPCACCSAQFHNHTTIPHQHHPDSLRAAAVAPDSLCEGPRGHAPRWDGSPAPRPPPDCCPSSCPAPAHRDPVGVAGGPRSHRTSAPCTPAGAAHSRGRVETPPSPSACLNQYCSAQAPSLPAVEGPAGLLPADAYRILQDQDRQLKLLHAQIQKLLEAQERTAGQSSSTERTAGQSSSTERTAGQSSSTERTAGQSSSTERTAGQSSSTEQAAVQTRAHSVSIAVGTGASLFWGDPVRAPSPEEPPGQDGRGLSGQDGRGMLESGRGMLDGSGTSRRSSGVANLSHRRDHEEGEGEEQVPSSPSDQSVLRHQGVFGDSCVQSPVLGESASMYYQPPSPERDDQAGHQTRTLDEDFYQKLLGQVNSRLQGSVNEEDQEEIMESSRRSSSPPRERRASLSPEELSPYQTPSSDHVPRCSWRTAPSLEQTDRDQVLSATLRQLKQLGVRVELDSADPGRATRASVESASTLAFIHPEAVLPRLALPESAGASMWGPGSGVDLSLEANAIALKYLSDAQLARLSLGPQQSSRPPLLLPSAALLSGKPCVDKSTAGLSLFSPSNMSMATQRYLRRYGLAEGGGGVEERDDDDDAVVPDERVQQPEQTKSSALKVLNPEGAHRPSPRPQHLDSQSQLLRDLLPKMQLLNHQTKPVQDKENCAKARPSLGEAHRGGAQPGGSVGNFLDLSRLRQLPKLF